MATTSGRAAAVQNPLAATQLKLRYSLLASPEEVEKQRCAQTFQRLEKRQLGFSKAKPRFTFLIIMTSGSKSLPALISADKCSTLCDGSCQEN
ncbi:Minor fimbrial subunit HifE [Trichinella spiralis]|uniref:Minor fimbrial subunit HifE n=1 Tax=Trichinella spiralis TaxID=6334 RepID=A0ABR3KEJ8_TRISP